MSKKWIFGIGMAVAMLVCGQAFAKNCSSGFDDCLATDDKAYCKGYMQSTCLDEASKTSSARRCMNLCTLVKSNSFCKGYCKKN